MTNHWIYFWGEEKDTIQLTALIQGRRTLWGGLNYTILRGPVCDDKNGLIQGIKALLQHLEKEKAVRLRINPYWDYPAGEAVEAQLRQMGFTISNNQEGLHCQTIIIDLSLSDEEILQKSRKSTRYEIRRAQKIGLSVNIAEKEGEVRSFYYLLRNTGHTKGFRVPAYSFFLKLWDMVLKDQNLGILLMTYFQDRPVSGSIILKHGKRAVYSWGASNREHGQNIPKNHLAIWKGILWAREKGCSLFDMGGYAGTPENDSMENIDLFKKGFGGNFCQLVRSYQFVFLEKKTMLGS
jgi:lipid II:glycine glycyltransferase (peptidoglycan interpeptide bridge formation enzyme)